MKWPDDLHTVCAMENAEKGSRFKVAWQFQFDCHFRSNLTLKGADNHPWSVFPLVQRVMWDRLSSHIYSKYEATADRQLAELCKNTANTQKRNCLVHSLASGMLKWISVTRPVPVAYAAVKHIHSYISWWFSCCGGQRSTVNFYLTLSGGDTHYSMSWTWRVTHWDVCHLQSLLLIKVTTYNLAVYYQSAAFSIIEC